MRYFYSLPPPRLGGVAMALPLLRLFPSSRPRFSRLFASSFSSPSSPRIPCSPNRPNGGILSLRHRGPSAFAAIGGGAAAVVEEVEESSGMSRTRLIAQNIPWTCTADDIRTLFANHGAVVDVELSMHKGNRNRGLAFVTMASEEEALTALRNLNSYEFDGRVIKVEFSRSVRKTRAVEARPIPKHNVFVGNLTWRVRSHDLRELFKDSGNVLSAEVIFQDNPRRSAGYGFVSFSSKEEAEAAITTLNGQKLMGRPIRLVLGNNQADNGEKKLDNSEQSEDEPKGAGAT